MKHLAVILTAVACQGATINVTDFGAAGDAENFTCNTVSNSEIIAVTSSPFSAQDVGKVVQLFGAGVVTSDTNHQDYIGTVTSVSGSNVTLSTSVGATLSGAPGTIGTDNRAAFQSIIDSLSATNDVIQIPTGRYLLMSEFQLTNGVMSSVFETHPALTISRGGITFQGETGTVLLNCGAWLLKTNYVNRGVLFHLKGPITNNYPLVFDTITFDGGVAQGLTPSNLNWPANTTNGTGWDLTHDVFFDLPPAPVHAQKLFRNCTFQHWRGEMLKTGVATTSGEVTITNCLFYDGNASAFNYGLAHRINNTRFDSVQLAMEFYSGFASQPSFFENNVVTNTVNGLVIVGALTNHTEQLYTISGNSIASSGYVMLMAPARNLLITNNLFWFSGFTTSAASVQGTDKNADWTVVDNVFTNFNRVAIFVNSSGTSDATENIVFLRNKSYGDGQFQFATGVGLNESIRFSSNQMFGALVLYTLDSRTLLGKAFYDDGSNEFPSFANKDFVGVTNTLTYNVGARQDTVVTANGSVWNLDDSTPSKIPDGALLMLRNTGTKPVVYRTSQGRSLIVQTNAGLTFYWRGGKWKDSRMGYAGTARIGTIN